MTLDEFKASLQNDTPPAVSLPLRALWFDGRGDWTAAHDLLQYETQGAGAWVHAYLHRKEGDNPNAAYWYRRASQPVASGNLEREWDAITSALLIT